MIFELDKSDRSKMWVARKRFERVTRHCCDIRGLHDVKPFVRCLSVSSVPRIEIAIQTLRLDDLGAVSAKAPSGNGANHHHAR
jgi:hypothetical protein